MNLKNGLLAKEIFSNLGLECSLLDCAFEIKGINDIYNCNCNEVIYLDTPKIISKVNKKENLLIITTEKINKIINKSDFNRCCFCFNSNPFSVFKKILFYLIEVGEIQHNENCFYDGISISKKYPKSTIHHGSYIGKNVEIGENTTIYPGAIIYSNVTIGKNVVIKPGAIIGCDGFYFSLNNEKIPSVGNVVIGDNVEIGANTTIVRSQFNTNKIGENTKIDNLVHIAHDVCIGENCLIMANTGVAGQVTIGDNVRIGGMSCIVNPITIEDNTFIYPFSYVIKDTKKGKKYIGNPASEYFSYLNKRARDTLSSIYREELEKYTNFIKSAFPDEFPEKSLNNLRTLFNIIKEAAGLKKISLRDRIEDLGIDSLELAESIIAIEDKFNIDIDEKLIQSVNTVKDLVQIVNGCLIEVKNERQ